VRRAPRTVLALVLVTLAALLALGSSKKSSEPRFPAEEERERVVPPRRPVALGLPYPACPGPSGSISRRALGVLLERRPAVFLQGVEVEMVERSALAAPERAPAGGGTFGGWRLRRFHPGDPCLGRAAVRPGDVIVSVNDQALRKPEDLFTLWSTLGTARNLVVRLERDGEPLLFVIQIRD
jgi:hypothetical protein